MTEDAGRYYRGAKIARVPGAPGLYAWYYKPRLRDWSAVSAQLVQLLDANVRVETCATLRYGVQLRSVADATMHHAGDGGDVPGAIEGLDAHERETVMTFLTDDAFLSFARPLYIGIAKALNRRVYDQHYSSLVSFWEDGHEVNRFMLAEPRASVERLTAALGIKRSFALEARARNIAPGDLIVYACPMAAFAGVATDDDESADAQTRRNLERVLQLLADPICGRR